MWRYRRSGGWHGQSHRPSGVDVAIYVGTSIACAQFPGASLHQATDKEPWRRVLWPHTAFSAPMTIQVGESFRSDECGAADPTAVTVAEDSMEH